MRVVCMKNKRQYLILHILVSDLLEIGVQWEHCEQSINRNFLTSKFQNSAANLQISSAWRMPLGKLCLRATEMEDISIFLFTFSQSNAKSPLRRETPAGGKRKPRAC